MIPTTEYMQGKYGHNYDCRPHSRECDCETCNEWCEDWRQYEEHEHRWKFNGGNTMCADCGEFKDVEPRHILGANSDGI